MRVDLLVPLGNDRVSRLSEAIADRTRERLDAEGHDVVAHSGDNCTEAILQSKHLGEGVAFFGHGYPDQIPGSDERPLFAGDGASRLQNRWLHTFACESTYENAKRFLDSGAICIVGYQGRLRPDWSFDGLPDPLDRPFTAFLTQVTSDLARGTRDLKSLKQAYLPLLNRIIEFCDEHPDHASIGQFCEQIHRTIHLLPQNEA